MFNIKTLTIVQHSKITRKNQQIRKNATQQAHINI